MGGSDVLTGTAYDDIFVIDGSGVDSSTPITIDAGLGENQIIMGTGSLAAADLALVSLINGSKAAYVLDQDDIIIDYHIGCMSEPLTDI